MVLCIQSVFLKMALYVLLLFINTLIKGLSPSTLESFMWLPCHLWAVDIALSGCHVKAFGNSWANSY